MSDFFSGGDHADCGFAADQLAADFLAQPAADTLVWKHQRGEELAGLPLDGLLPHGTHHVTFAAGTSPLQTLLQLVREVDGIERRGKLHFPVGCPLVVTGLALAIQSRRAGILAGEVAVLNAEVTAATSAIEAYQIRFLQVRSEVGDLVSRVSVLKSLVARDVVPTGISGAESDASPAPTYRD